MHFYLIFLALAIAIAVTIAFHNPQLSLQAEEIAMPFLSAMAAFRDSVRKEAIAIKATNILAECDKLRDDTLPELGVRLEDKVARS